MAIESSAFGGCRLTGEDAIAFRRQFLEQRPASTKDLLEQNLQEAVQISVENVRKRVAGIFGDGGGGC